MVASRYVLADGSNLDEQGAMDINGPRVTARCTFDPSGTPAHRAVGTHILGPVIPAKAIITATYANIRTSFASAAPLPANTATLMLYLETSQDVHDTGPVGEGFYTQCTIRTFNPDSFEYGFQLAAGQQLKAVVGVEPLTAGHMVIFIDYVVGD